MSQAFLDATEIMQARAALSLSRWRATCFYHDEHSAEERRIGYVRALVHLMAWWFL